MPVSAAATLAAPGKGSAKEVPPAEQGQEGEARTASSWRTREIDRSSMDDRRCFSTSSASMASREGLERPVTEPRESEVEDLAEATSAHESSPAGQLSGVSDESPSATRTNRSSNASSNGVVGRLLAIMKAMDGGNENREGEGDISFTLPQHHF